MLSSDSEFSIPKSQVPLSAHARVKVQDFVIRQKVCSYSKGVFTLVQCDNRARGTSESRASDNISRSLNHAIVVREITFGCTYNDPLFFQHFGLKFIY